jgi:hypothetical protein
MKAAINSGVDHELLLEQLLSALPENIEGFRQICSRIGNWDLLFESALFHGVESVLCHHLMDVKVTLPPDLRDSTERWLKVRTLWQSHARHALDEALTALDAAAVPTVALKGPILGERLYPKPFLRPSADLDLLVTRADLDKATAALESIGYRHGKESQARFLRKFHYHTILGRPCPPLVELHFSLSDRFGVEIPAEEFLSRAVAYRSTAGAPARVLSPEDEMLYLSIHAAGHRFTRLSWLYDIKLLLMRHPGLKWKTVVARARELKLLSALLYTREVLERRLGVAISESAPARRTRSRIANFLLEATARQPECSRGSLVGKMAFTAVLCDRPAAAAAFLQRQLLFVVRRRARRHFPSFVPEEWSY